MAFEIKLGRHSLADKNSVPSADISNSTVRRTLPSSRAIPATVAFTEGYRLPCNLESQGLCKGEPSSQYQIEHGRLLSVAQTTVYEALELVPLNWGVARAARAVEQ
jgi:hypothetical protein